MSKWITDRLPTAADCDENMDVLIPDKHNIFGHSFYDHRSVRHGEPWHPKPEKYVPPEPPKTREEKVQDLLAAIRDFDRDREDEKWLAVFYKAELLSYETT